MASFNRNYLTLLVLSLLNAEEMYAYRICQVIKERTGGQYELKQGALYPLLHGLEKSGIIEGEWRPGPYNGIDRKYFRLTPKGERILEQERETFGALAHFILVPQVPRG